MSSLAVKGPCRNPYFFAPVGHAKLRAELVDYTKLGSSVGLYAEAPT